MNQDFTVSPTGAPGMVWGLRTSDGCLILVKRGSNNQLVFDDLPLPFKNMKKMKFAPSNFPGKAVVLTTAKQQSTGLH